MMQKDYLLSEEDNDMNTAVCLQDKLSQMNTEYTLMQESAARLNSAIDDSDTDRANQEFIIVHVYSDTAKKISQTANQCMGFYNEIADIPDVPAAVSSYTSIPSSPETSTAPVPDQSYALSISETTLSRIAVPLSDYTMLQQRIQNEIPKITQPELLADNITLADTQQMLLSDDLAEEVLCISHDQTPVSPQTFTTLQQIESGLIASHNTTTQGINQVVRSNTSIASQLSVNDVHNLGTIVHNTLLVPQTSQTVQQTVQFMQMYMQSVQKTSSLLGQLSGTSQKYLTLQKQLISSLILQPDQLKSDMSSTPATAAVVSNILPLNALSAEPMILRLSKVSLPDALKLSFSQMQIDQQMINQFVEEKQSSVYIYPIIVSFNRTNEDTKHLLGQDTQHAPQTQSLSSTANKIASSVNQATKSITANTPPSSENTTQTASKIVVLPTSSVHQTPIPLVTPIPTVSSGSNIPTGSKPAPMIPIPTQYLTLQQTNVSFPTLTLTPTVDPTLCSNSNPGGTCVNGETCQNVSGQYSCAYPACTGGTSCHNPYANGAYSCGAQCDANGSRCCMAPSPNPTVTAVQTGQICKSSYGGACYSWARGGCPRGYSQAVASSPYIDCPVEFGAPHQDYCCIAAGKNED